MNWHCFKKQGFSEHFQVSVGGFTLKKGHRHWKQKLCVSDSIQTLLQSFLPPCLRLVQRLTLREHSYTPNYTEDATNTHISGGEWKSWREYIGSFGAAPLGAPSWCALVDLFARVQRLMPCIMETRTPPRALATRKYNALSYSSSSRVHVLAMRSYCYRILESLEAEQSLSRHNGNISLKCNTNW